MVVPQGGKDDDEREASGNVAHRGGCGREEETGHIGGQRRREQRSLAQPDDPLPMRRMRREPEGKVADLLVEAARLDGLHGDLEPSPFADDVSVDPHLADDGGVE